MKLVRFLSEAGEVCAGRLLEGRMAELAVDGFAMPLRFSGRKVPVIKLLPPVQPPNVFAIGRNYAAHAAETGSQAPESPLIFMKPTTALTPPSSVIVLPAAAPNEVDYEAELAIVIGRLARNVTESEAFEYVLGYTCANDVSARDCQRNDKQWSRAKGFDTFCPLGPWIVTADEFNPGGRLVRSRLNGNVMQEASTASMIHSCPKLVQYLSAQFTLLPGTLILTGTPEGVGFARTPPVFLRDGDQIEVEIEGLGTLINYVARDRIS